MALEESVCSTYTHMALKRSKGKQQDQLDLFGCNGNGHAPVDSIRIDGGDTLAGAPSADGGGNGSGGHATPDVAGRRGEDQGRNGRDSPEAHPAGAEATAGTRPGLGNGEGEVDSASPRKRLGPPRNQANYRISDQNRLGEG